MASSDAIIIDNGTGFLKAGCTSDEAPRVVIPSTFEKVSYFLRSYLKNPCENDGLERPSLSTKPAFLFFAKQEQLCMTWKLHTDSLLCISRQLCRYWNERQITWPVSSLIFFQLFRPFHFRKARPRKTFVSRRSLRFRNWLTREQSSVALSRIGMK